MNKDKITSIRINSEILEKLKKMGYTPQRLIDERINQLLKVEISKRIKIIKQQGKGNNRLKVFYGKEKK